MKRLMLCVSFLLSFLVLVPGVHAQFNKAGRTSFQFVKIGIGARQVALGEASVAIVRDVNAVFWNPANIAGIQTGAASFSYARWFADMNYVAGAAAVNFRGIGVLGVGISSLRYGDIPEAFATGPRLDTRTGSTFTGNDLMVSASFARQFTDQLSIGVTAKFLQEKLFTYSTSLAAFDIGSYYDTGFRGIKLGMSFQNFSKSVKFLPVGDREEGYDIPLVFRVGAAVDLVGQNGFVNLGETNKFTFTFESVNSNDYGDRWHVGGEYAFENFLFLRGGYRLNYDEGNLSLGAGIHQKLADFDVQLDYSFTSYKFLESPHRITLSIGF